MNIDRVIGQATRLAQNYQRTGVIKDLDDAIRMTGQAILNMLRTGHTLLPLLHSIGRMLGWRFERTGAIEDLNRAVVFADMAVNITRPDHPDRVALLGSLGNWLGRRFERTGVIEDLNRAIEVTDMAVSITPPGHPDQAALLNNLGSWLGRRFERTGAIEELNHAIEVTDMALAITSDHSDRAGRLNNLGNWLGSRFERAGAIEDLNRAIEVTDMAVSITPPGHPDQAALLSNLGSWLGRRFERTGAIEDLNRAIEVSDMAVTITPHGHPDQVAQLNNLAALLGTRFQHTGDMEDLNRAIKTTAMAVTITPSDRHDRAAILLNLGSWASMRFTLTGDKLDIEASILTFKEGWNCQNARPSIRIDLARKAATLLASQSNWEESSKFLEDAVKLLPAVSPRLLKNIDKQHMLREFAGLASMAAAIALKAGKEPHHALELLELGRGVIAGLLMEMRTDISDLKQNHREIAEEFESFRDELDSPINRTALSLSSDNSSSLVSRVNRRREVGQKFEEVVAKIRAQPGFKNFLLPPTADELMAAADPGPIVVVNISSYRCDAFLIERHQIRALELPNLSLEEVEKKVQERRSRGITSLTLKWLWDVAAHSILEALGFQQPISDDNWPHIWWVLTGALGHLPLHAAGLHNRGSTETVVDRVISSYSSSVKALMYGRRHSVQNPVGPVPKHALLVAMRETPGLSFNSVLPFAEDEVAMLKQLCLSLQLETVEPQRLKDDVLVRLRTCKIFHFAGHGQSNPSEPSQSCLLLEDWKNNPLTVGDLRDHRLQETSPFLGYLSACSTGANEADRLIDEGIHLVSACQLAGFRHVVGTLWEVSDKHCVDIAKVLYETLRDEGMTDVALCRGLHRAIRALRDSDNEMRGEGRDAKLLDGRKEQEKPLYWVPYIHFGI
jgi:tetratricopeptide (TPR) repeat protein